MPFHRCKLIYLGSVRHLVGSSGGFQRGEHEKELELFLTMKVLHRDSDTSSPQMGMADVGDIKTEQVSPEGKPG